MQASKRAAAFTRQLLAFSRKQVLQPRLINLSAVVQRTKKMLGRLIGEKYEIQLHCPNELPSVLADEGRHGTDSHQPGAERARCHARGRHASKSRTEAVDPR